VKIPLLLFMSLEIINKIRNNQLKQVCKGFVSCEPKSKCANCGRHYLEHPKEKQK
jgi:hypothetical protein